MAALTQYVVIAAVLVPTFGVGLYQASDRAPCLHILSTDLETPVVRVGDLLHVTYQITSKAGCLATASRVMLDGANIPVPLTGDASFLSGEAAESYPKSVALMIPRAVPGNAQLRMTLTMSSNWFQRMVPVVVVQKDVNFSIIPQPQGAQGG